MKCNCHNLPDIFYIDQAPHGFAESLHQEDIGNWLRLYSCPSCGTLWVIDEWEKYQDQVVSRIKDRTDWSGQERTAERKQLLLKSRGGRAEETCIWSGCNAKRIKGVVYCLDHLWKTGARR